MKNIPRIFIDQPLKLGARIPLDKDILHYLTRVMRTDKCLVFNNGIEFNATIMNYELCIMNSTDRPDPSNDITFCFSPIKKTDEMLNMVTQMGVAKLQPVITDRTVAHHVNWDRMKKIIIEAAEQSGRNSVPELLPPQKFGEFLAKSKEQIANSNKLIFADERAVYSQIQNNCSLLFAHCSLLIGPEGGFSDSEFAALDAMGAIGISLGKTILRAETAAVAALAIIGNRE